MASLFLGRLWCVLTCGWWHWIQSLLFWEDWRLITFYPLLPLYEGMSSACKTMSALFRTSHSLNATADRWLMDVHYLGKVSDSVPLACTWMCAIKIVWMKWKAHCVLVQTVWTLPHTLFCFPFSFCILSVSFQSLLCVAVFGWTFHTCGMPCLGSPICSFPAFELLSYFCILQASSFFSFGLVVVIFSFFCQTSVFPTCIYEHVWTCEGCVCELHLSGPLWCDWKAGRVACLLVLFFVCQDGLIACVMWIRIKLYLQIVAELFFWGMFVGGLAGGGSIKHWVLWGPCWAAQCCVTLVVPSVVSAGHL